MRIILNPADTDDALDHIHDLVITLRREHAELRSRYLTDRDGYPIQSLGGGGGGATNEIDDDGTPIPQHSDPVGRLVVARDDPTDPIGQALAELVRKIHDARRLLEAAVSDAGRARPPIKVTDPDELWCENHLKAGMYEPREQGRKVCRWCREERAEHRKLPSIRLMQAKARGRVTPTLRREIQLRDAEDRRAERKRRKCAS